MSRPQKQSSRINSITNNIAWFSDLEISAELNKNNPTQELKNPQSKTSDLKQILLSSKSGIFKPNNHKAFEIKSPFSQVNSPNQSQGKSKKHSIQHKVFHVSQKAKKSIELENSMFLKNIRSFNQKLSKSESQDFLRINSCIGKGSKQTKTLTSNHNLKRRKTHKKKFTVKKFQTLQDNRAKASDEVILTMRPDSIQKLPKSKIRIRTSLGIGERLDLTSEQNKALAFKLSKKRPPTTFMDELRKQKKQKDIQKFTRIFNKENSENKLSILRGRRFRRQKSWTNNFVITSKEKNCPPRNRKAPKITISKFLDKKVFKTEKIIKSSSNKKIYSYPSDFLKFIKKIKILDDFFNHGFTKEIISKSGNPKLFKNCVLTREEITLMTKNLLKYFTKETNNLKRIHLAVIQMTDIAYKLRRVYRENGDLIIFLLTQIVRDLKGFKNDMTQASFKIVKSNQVEIIRMEDRFKKREQALAIQIKVLKEQVEQKSKQDELLLKENQVLKKIIKNLKSKNFNYMTRISEIKQSTIKASKSKEKKEIKKTDVKESKRRFKKVIGKIIPGFANKKKLSIVNLVDKIKLLSKLQNNYNSGGQKNSFMDANMTPAKNNNLTEVQFFSHKKTEKVSKGKSQTDSYSEISNEEGPKISVFPQRKAKEIINSHKITSKMKPCSNSIKKKTKMTNSLSRSNKYSDAQQQTPKMIGKYLISDIAKLSKYYLVPEDGTNNKSIQASIKTAEIQTQTYITLVNKDYDTIFKNKVTFKNFVNDYNFRQKMSHQSVIKRFSNLRREEFKKKKSMPAIQKFHAWAKQIIPRKRDDENQSDLNSVTRFKKSVFQMMENMSDANNKKPLHKTFGNFNEINKDQKAKLKNVTTNFSVERKRNLKESEVITGNENNLVDQKDQIKSIFRDFLKENILERSDLVTQENKLIWITKFFMNEEIKNEKLQNENKKYEAITAMLKEMFIKKSHNNKKTKSLFLKKSHENISSPEIIDDTILQNKKLFSTWQAKKTKQINDSYKKYIRKAHNKKSIFKNKKYKKLWVKLHSFLKKKIQKIETHKIGKSKLRLFYF